MKLWRTAVLVGTLTLLLVPASAIADDVHIKLRLSHVGSDEDRKLKVAGRLHLLDDVGEACKSTRQIFIERKKNGEWDKPIPDETDEDGYYRKRIADKAGRYRISAPEILGTSCETVHSAWKRHSH